MASRRGRAAAVAGALAAAFLDGEWSSRGMGDRASIALGATPEWLRPLARRICVAFPDPPLDAFEALADAIGADRAFQNALATGPRLDVRRTFLPQAAMRADRPSWDVRALDTEGDVAEWLGLSLGELAWMADWRGLSRANRDPRLGHYVRRWTPKRSGGFRLLEAPKSRLKAAQARILREIVDGIPPHPAAHGFRKGFGVLSHAALHAGKALVLRMDLEDFFLSIPAARVYAVFRAAGYAEGVSRVLTGLCTTRAGANEPLDLGPGASHAAAAEIHRTRQRARSRHLPQGAPTSPALANLCAFALDVRLSAAAAGARYSRYADDLAFSGDDDFARSSARFAAFVAAIAADEGFRVQHRKTRAMPRGGRQEITGIVVNAHPAIRRADLDRLRALLHNCVRFGPRSQNRDGQADFRGHLEGKIAWVSQVQPTRGAKLRELARRIDWSA